MKDLPTLPIVVAKILQTAASPHASAADLQALIAVDAGLTAKILRLANSSFYGQSRRITTLKDAIVILGFNTVRNLTLSASMLDSLSPRGAAQVFDWRAYWEHCAGVAACARLLARRRGLPTAVQEEAFVAGLLHDIGKLFLGRYCPDVLADIVLNAETFQVSMEEAEWRLIGTTHALLGQEIAEQWNFPAPLASAIGAHHHPDGWRDDPTLTYLVHTANVLTQQAGVGALDPQLPRLDAEVDGWLSLNTVQREDLIIDLHREMSDMEALLGWESSEPADRPNTVCLPAKAMGEAAEDDLSAVVHEKALAIARVNTLAELRDLLMAGAAALAPIWGSTLFLWDDDQSRFTPRAGNDLLARIGEAQLRESLLDDALPLAPCPTGCLAPVAAPRALRSLGEGHRFLVCALAGSQKTIGFLLLGQSAREIAPTDAQGQALQTLAAHAAAAILRVQSFQISVGALAHAIDARDPNGGAHSSRVRDMAIACAKHLGLTEARSETLEVAALLHDVGKLSIPDHILAKPGQLNPEEFRNVAGHSSAGAHLAGHTFGEVMPFILCHHERWDGSGYPAGLRENQIPLESQIIAVCEAWDAMRGDRPYRAALSVEAARRELRGNSGTQFDPAVVDAFLAVAPGAKTGESVT